MHRWLRPQVSNSSPGGPLCLLVFWLFSAPLVHSSHWLAKEWIHLGLQALIDSWLKGNHKNLQTLRPSWDSVWHPWLRPLVPDWVVCGSSINNSRHSQDVQLLVWPNITMGKKMNWSDLTIQWLLVPTRMFCASQKLLYSWDFQLRENIVK